MYHIYTYTYSQRRRSQHHAGLSHTAPITQHNTQSYNWVWGPLLEILHPFHDSIHCQIQSAIQSTNCLFEDFFKVPCDHIKRTNSALKMPLFTSKGHIPSSFSLQCKQSHWSKQCHHCHMTSLIIHESIMSHSVIQEHPLYLSSKNSILWQSLLSYGPLKWIKFLDLSVFFTLQTWCKCLCIHPV